MFKVTVAHKFQFLQEETTEGKWQILNTAVISTCQKVLGNKKHDHKEWMTAKTLKKIEQRKKKKVARNNNRTRAGKVKAQEQCSEAHTVVRRSR